MNFRTRLFFAIAGAVVIPLAALALGVRRELDQRLSRDYDQRAGSMVRAIESELARESGAVGLRLHALVGQLAQDNRFRLAAQGDPTNRAYLLDYGGRAMRLSGLSLLQIQDSSGRILSSGHFRNEFDRLAPRVPRLIAGMKDSLLLLRARTPDSSVVGLVRIDSVRLGGRTIDVIGGTAAQDRLLANLPQDSTLAVDLVYPGAEAMLAPGHRVVRELKLSYIDLTSGADPTLARAQLRVTQSLEPLESLRRGVNIWVLVAMALTLIVALTAAAGLAAMISRPLRELAEKTSRIDLDRLDQSFATERSDEIGALSRLLAAMTDRLRASSARLREVERRAAVGDLARQVNHDIKNGLAPIRNVLRHLTQSVRQDPGSLPTVFEERRGTLESSIEYLDTLARNYDRLAPGLERAACDVNAIVDEIARNTAAQGKALHTNLSPQLAPALGDTLMIRRIMENLVGNALDSVAQRPDGVVTISTEWLANSEGAGLIRVAVADTGSGMSQAELDRAFDDFYTTKPGGSGLGLSIVRRLILDLNGTLRVETRPGQGTTVMVDLPAAAPARPSQ